MEIQSPGRESWVVQGGYQFCPNGYVPGGQIRVGKPQFVPAGDGFMGFGRDERHFDRSITFNEIDYILTETEDGLPLRVVLNSGERGFLFVAGNFTQVFKSDPHIAAADRRILIFLYKQISGRKEDISRSGLKARAIAFTELGIKHAQENDFQR
jgi:hypothetical protein